MDKYEFNIKVEQIKKLVNRGDYDTAMKIADTIDWHRVRNASLLSMIAQIYEKNEEYQEAKDILLLAFERAPVGKRLLYKLADLALKEGSVAEAEAYYREFCDLAPDDPRQYLLRYLILKAKKAPVDQLIRSLETYTSTEVDEKWLYELAELYHEAGKSDLCVSTCDKIMLLFGLGKYVDKAMDLKLQHAPLSKYQMDLVENRDKYEERLRAVEEEYNGNTPYQEDYEEAQASEARPAERNLDMEKEVVMKIHEDAQTQKLAEEMSKMSGEEMHTANITEDDDMDTTRTLDDIRSIKDIKPTKRVLDAAAEREAAEQEAAKRAEEEREIERQREAIRAAKAREEMEEEALRRAEEEREAARRAEAERRAKRQAEIDRERALQNRARMVSMEDDDLELESLDDVLDCNNLMIEADTEEEGLSMALEALKKIHKELGYKNPVAKISSDKLNKRGISSVASKLAGKDLVIEHAADLTDAVQNELDELMEKDKSGMIVVLIDAPEKLEELHGRNASLAEKFQYIGADSDAALKRQTEADVEEALKKETEVQEKISRDVVQPIEKPAKEPKKAAEPEESEEPEDSSEEAYEEETEREADDADFEDEEPEEDEYEEEPAPVKKKGGFFGRKKKEPEEIPEEESEEEEAEPELEEEKEEEPVDNSDDYNDEREMDLDEFAQYACKYASEIDCSIAGKSLLALYERIEMMEEDGVPLTKRTAIDLIEEAADKAEKPSLGRKITGLFSPKYDKDGYLILHEDNFFD